MATFAKRSINKAKRFAGIKNNKTHNSTVTQEFLQQKMLSMAELENAEQENAE